MAEVTSSFKPYVVSIEGLAASDETSWKGFPWLTWWGAGFVTLKGWIKVAVQYMTKAGEQISWTEYVIESGQTRTFSNVNGQDMCVHLLETEPPTPPPVYTCPYCPATFDTQAELDAHIASEHPEPPSPPPGAFTWNGCKLLYAGEINVGQVLAAGFNTAICYVNQARLDECLRKGLWVIPNLWSFLANDNLTGAVAFVNQWKNHPVVAAWLFMDEPELKEHATPTRQMEWRAAIKAADPNHDLLAVFTTNPDLPHNNYNPSAFDHCGVDCYCFNETVFRTGPGEWNGDWRGFLRGALGRWNSVTGGIGGMATVQTFYDTPTFLSPLGNIKGMLEIFQSLGIGGQSNGYAMWCWTLNGATNRAGISEDSALLNEVRGVNASYPWPHPGPGDGEETFTTKEITCSVCESVLRVTISSIGANNRTLTCPLCQTTLPEAGTKVEIVSTPVIDQLRADVRALDEQIEQAEVKVDAIKKLLGM